jgi:uncharacterized NAD(P)/FAD-binding protein YdhS
MIGDRYDVAIVGGGFSGAMLAARLVTQRRSHPIHVALVDRTGRFGCGIAYGTSNPRHLLNVPAGMMSALEDVPDHFFAWAKRRVAGVERGTYLPRTLYGDYVASVLDDAISHKVSRSTIELRVGSARRIDLHAAPGGGARLHLDDGTIVARKVVLATGNAASRRLAVPGAADPAVRARWVADPWAPGAIEPVAGEGDVLVIGTGLTMIDVALEVIGRGHRGRVFAISRRGLLPQPHLTAPAPAGSWLDREALAAPMSANALARAVRGAVARAAAAGVDWRAVVAELRPLTPALWQRLGPDGQGRFLRHLAPWWETHRHRVAPAVHDVVLGLLATGQLVVGAGRLVAVEPRGGRIVAKLFGRGEARADDLPVSAIVNCSGPDPDVTHTTDPLLLSLVAQGAIRPGPHSLGLDVTPSGAFIGETGDVSDALFAIGPLRRGHLYETTAVPEIRAQIAAMAATLGAGT